MTTWRRLLLTTTVLLAGLATTAPWASAQEPVAPGVEQLAPGEEIVNSWALAPAGSSDPSQPGNRPALTYESAPGSVVQDAVTLYNYSNVQLTFRLYASDAFNTEDGSFDVLPGDEQPTDVGTWVQFAQENVTVPARTEVTIPITVTVPATATAGDHVGALLASSQAQGTAPDGKAVVLDRRTGTRIYVRVPGDLLPDLTVDGVGTSYTAGVNPMSGTAQVSFAVVNRGNVRAGGQYRVRVSGPLGLLATTTDAVELPELLPGEELDLSVTVEGVPALVLAEATVLLEPSGTEGLEADEPTEAGATAFAPPVTVLAVLALVGLGLFAGRAYRRRRPGSAPPPSAGLPEPSAGPRAPTAAPRHPELERL